MKESLNLLMETLATGIISIAAAYAAYYIRQATAKVKAEISAKADERQQVLFNTAVERVNSLAEMTVTAIEQTTAGALRQAVKNGETDRQLLLDLGYDAVLQIKEQLADEYKTVLIAQCGDIDTYISNAVEAKVYELKQKESDCLWK